MNLKYLFCTFVFMKTSLLGKLVKHKIYPKLPALRIVEIVSKNNVICEYLTTNNQLIRQDFSLEDLEPAEELDKTEREIWGGW